MENFQKTEISMRPLRVGESLNLPEEFEKDEFSAELIRLWLTRNMSGKIFTVSSSRDKIDGFCIVQESNKYTIRGLFILPGSRGNKLGLRLLQTVCAIYRDKDLWVNIADTAEALVTYERCGFRVLGRRTDFPEQFIGYLGSKVATDVLDEVRGVIGDR